MKILICDDSMTIRKKLSTALLKLIDCEIIEAKDGDEAITTYKEEQPDLVFMDIIMPVRDGLEAVAEIMTYDKNAKIVMLSSVGTRDNLQKALKFGAIDFIQKPFEITRLKQLFKVHFGKEL